MRITFLGGADEIGASCLLVEMAGKRLLVDCGVRQGARARDPLPDLALTQAEGGVDAIVVTHAHFDHTGALPVAHAAYPGVPVWCTDPTRQLVGILLRDSLKIMGGRAGSEGDVPLYPEAAVDALLARIEGHRFLEPEEIVPGVWITFFPAGHILGAAAIGFESTDGRLLITGDISVADQLTVPGMMAPRFRADAVVVESTYGDRLHASRLAEERRIVESVGQTLARGGKVLIPAFAIGRAQEVILILRRAMAKKQIVPFPIHVDGMVRSVCEVYRDHPDWLSGALKRKIEKKGNPFWGEDEWVRPVRKPEERSAIVAGPPCAVVASSGMLTGGASTFYAAAFAGGEGNLIAITGYQDEESPGRKLLELAEGRASTLFLAGQSAAVACSVTKYSLSAHADSGEIAGLIDRLHPKDLVLVHGESGARRVLAQKLAPSVRNDLHLPVLGDSLTFSYRRPRPSSVASARAQEPAAAGPQVAITSDLLAGLAERLSGNPPGRAYSLADLATLMLGPCVDRTRREAWRRLLIGPGSPVVPDTKRPFLFRRPDGRASADRAPAEPAPRRDESGRLEQNEALALADTLLGPGTGLLRKGAQRETWELVLVFDFPDVARSAHAAALNTLKERSGWEVILHPEANQARLVAEAVRVTPSGWASERSLAIHRDDRRVVVFTDPRLPLDPSLAESVLAAFRDTTGWSLEFHRDDPRPVGAVGGRRDARGRLEINHAYEAIRQAFVDRPHRPRKIGLKTDSTGPAIEVGFVSPQVASRYGELLESVSRDIGWPVRPASRADQQEILRVAREAIPREWTLRKPLGLDPASAKVRVTLFVRPADTEISRVEALVLEQTGFRLDVQV